MMTYSAMNSCTETNKLTMMKISVSVSDPLPAISWTYHDIAAAGLDVKHSPSQVQGPGTCCLTISVIHHLAPTLSDQRWKLTSSQRTGTPSAVEASCVMRFTNRQSSSSSLRSACTMSSVRKFTFAISSPDEFLVLRCVGRLARKLSGGGARTNSASLSCRNSTDNWKNCWNVNDKPSATSRPLEAYRPSKLLYHVRRIFSLLANCLIYLEALLELSLIHISEPTRPY